MSVTEILAKVAAGKLTADEAAKLLPDPSAPRALSFKVSEKGAVSVYGLQNRFPVTLYSGQWERLIAQMDELKAFMAANKSKLSTKPAKE